MSVSEAQAASAITKLVSQGHESWKGPVQVYLYPCTTLVRLHEQCVDTHPAAYGPEHIGSTAELCCKDVSIVQAILHQICSLAIVYVRTSALVCTCTVEGLNGICWKVIVTMQLLDSLRLCLGTSGHREPGQHV